MTRFILVRHGQTEWNRVERFRGRVDLALNEAGIKQAEAVAEGFSRWQVAVVYTSPLRRSLATAQTLANRLGLVAQPLDALIDIDFGRWQGLSPQEVVERDGDLYQQWLDSPQDVRFPEGESLQEVRDRVMTAVADLAQKHKEQVVALVSHNVVCRVLLCAVLGLDNSHFWQIGQDVAAINIFEVHDKRQVLILLNDICHLKLLADTGS